MEGEYEEAQNGSTPSRQNNIVEACLQASLDYISKREKFPATKTKTAELRNAMMQSITQLKPSKLRKASRLRVTGDENKRIRDHVKDYVKTPPVVKTVDKALFTAGVAWVVTTEYILLCAPEKTGLWLVSSTVPLMAHRVVSFRRSGLSYFLFDFCYFANLLCLACIATGNPPRLFEIVFYLCNGPLLCAIVVWRTSFIFHSIDHVCSTVIHALPPLWTYTVANQRKARLLSAQHREGEERSADDDDESGLLHYPLLAALAVYTLWQLLYILKTEVLDRDYIRSHSSEYTSLRYLTKDPRSSLYRSCKSVLIKLGIMNKDEEFDESTAKTKMIFWGFQFVYTWVSLLPVKLMWHSTHFHTAFLCLINITAIYNGASYYIEVFSRRYNLKFDQHRD